MKVASLVFVVLLAFVFSCAYTLSEGTKIDGSKVEQIVKNKTTAQELEGILGKPYKVEKLGGGKETYKYYYKYEEYVRWNVLPKTMEQKLDVDLLNGVVTDYAGSGTAVDPMKN